MALPALSEIVSAVGDLAAGLANPFGLPAKDEWNLTQGSFKTDDSGKEVIFFFEKNKGENRRQKTGLEQISDSGGRRLAKFEYPYRDGQAVEDMGRMGEDFAHNIKFYGKDYQLLLAKFLDVVANSRESGVLTHPVRGQIKCRYKTHEIVHRHDEFNAVTIRVVFTENNIGQIAADNLKAASPDSPIRSALQTLNDLQGTIGSALFAVTALLLLPSAVGSALKSRLDSVTGSISRLLGQLAATFSSDAQLQSLAARSSGLPRGITDLTSGTQAGTQAVLPPVFQVGFSAADSAAINASSDAYINSNQVTPQQAVYTANQIRKEISSAMAEVESLFGNDGYEILLNYRALALSIQEAVESAIASANNTVKVYTVPFDMSLRMVAFRNGLSADRQNDLADLNPNLDSLNFVLKGTQVVVPSS